MGRVPAVRDGHRVLHRFAERHSILVVMVAHPGRVRQEHAQRDRPVGKGRVAQRPAEPAGGILVQRQQALLDQRHHSDRHHQFADRGDAYRIVDRRDPARGGIGEAPGEAALFAPAIEGHSSDHAGGFALAGQCRAAPQQERCGRGEQRLQHQLVLKLT